MNGVEKTDYEIGQDNVQIVGLDVHNPVFLISGLTIIAFVLLTLMFHHVRIVLSPCSQIPQLLQPRLRHQNGLNCRRWRMA